MEGIINVAISTSLITIIILSLKAVLKNKISPKWQFALWIVIALRLLVPVLPQSRVSIFNAVPQVKNIEVSDRTSRSVLPENKTYISGNIVVGEKKNEFTLSKTLVDNALVIWLSGSIIMFLYILIVYLIYHRKTRKFNISEDEEINSVLNECKRKLSINALIKVRIGGDTPLLKGIFNPEIILPKGYSREELKSIFMHELMHYKHRDVLWNILSMMLICAYWYNPVIWYGFKVFRRDMEILCDYRVLEVYSDRKLYASVLLKTALRKNKFLICTTSMQNGEKDICKRIKHIAYFKKPRVIWSIVGIIVTIMIATSCLTNPISKLTNDANDLDYKKLYECKTKYLGDASKVGNLAGNLYYAEYKKKISLKTDVRPYGVTVNYVIKPEEITQNGVVAVTDNMLKNAAVMFCLIDNVENITFSFDDGSGVYGFTFERNLINKAFDKDIREYSSSLESFKDEFIPRLEKVNWEDIKKSDGILDKSISESIERNLSIIMSSPNQSSNPGDYIKAHQKEYYDILIMGDKALEYMLSQFKKGEANGLKPHIMMKLCIDILGDRNNVKEGTYTSPQEWYNKLLPYTASKLPPFKYKDGNVYQNLVYSAALKKYSSGSDDTLTIVVPSIFGVDENGNQIKIFAIVYYSEFKLYNKTLSQYNAGVVPAAIVYTKNNKGTYTLNEYIEAKEGYHFEDSIKDFCKPRSDIADKIIEHYNNKEGLYEVIIGNLLEYLKENNMKGINLKQDNGKDSPLT